MPEIHIRPANSADLPALLRLDHTNETEIVWQLELHLERTPAPGLDPVELSFHQVRLPRPVSLDYPHDPQDWLAQDPGEHNMLVALLNHQPVGYTALEFALSQNMAWLTDLVVDRPWRRCGIGTALVLAALELAAQAWPAAGRNGERTLALVASPRNYPAIQLALHLGFEFSGFSDHFFAPHEIGVFFARPIPTLE